MSLPQHQSGDTPIKYIDTDAALAETCEILGQKKAFAFDTEFDRFYREYGFKLSLVQIFDGEYCYVIDPISIKNLQPLWPLFEDRSICKVVYSCSEDIQILKVNGCHPKNIYDLQIAARLCNYPANSLGDLIFDEFGVRPDKTLQRSNWRRRPLSAEQFLYAGNDVSRLLKLKDILQAIADKRGVSRMIEEENRACENIPVTEYKVKISVVQKRKYDHANQKILLSLLDLRNEIAMGYNVPPANIVSDATLESIIENKTAFLRAPFSKGFSRKFSEDTESKNKFLELIGNINETFTQRPAPEKKFPPRYPKIQDEHADAAFEEKYALLYEEIIGTYGKESGEYILRGFKKSVSAVPPNQNKLKGYQQNIIEAACSKLKLNFSR